MLAVAFVSTVALLVWMGLFMMSSLPLLILKHDTPLDSRFIRGVFNLYFVALTVTAAVGALSYGLSARPVIAMSLAGVTAIGLAGHRYIVGRMDAVRSHMGADGGGADGGADDAAAIGRFRRLHVSGMILNIVLLAGFCAGMTRLLA